MKNIKFLLKTLNLFELDLKNTLLQCMKIMTLQKVKNLGRVLYEMCAYMHNILS